jgi:hypothetical protein
MSREVKMVPLDFEWPLRKVWPGFLMPDDIAPVPCPHCDQSGRSAAYRELEDRWYGNSPFQPEERQSVPYEHDSPEAIAWAQSQIDRAPEYYGTGPVALIREALRICYHWNSHWSYHLNQDDVDVLLAEGRLMDLTHSWDGKRWVETGHIPSPAEVNRWSLSGMGHDAINCWAVVGAECDRLGAERNCPDCGGEGHTFRDEEHKRQYHCWEETPPPSGNAIQMWETTSEGSPISPPFETATELAKWLAETKASAFGRDTCTEQEWLAMIHEGQSIGSMVAVGGFDLMSGVEAVSAMDRQVATDGHAPLCELQSGQGVRDDQRS